MNLQKYLAVLSDCGITLRSEIDASELNVKPKRKEAALYLEILIQMGDTTKKDPYERISDDIWRLDAECIVDHGDYASIAERIRDLADAMLPISDIQDYVDLEEPAAWLSFVFKGEKIKWFAAVQDDWLDETILSRFVALLAQAQSGKRFTYFNLHGQDCLIGCSTSEQFAKLKNLGLDIEWLS